MQHTETYELFKDFFAPVVALVGIAVTGTMAGLGLRSFAKFKREKIEEKRIDAALDALVLIREARWVFENIRSPMLFDYETKDMPEIEGDDEATRNSRRQFYGIRKRVEFHREFFDRVYKLQVRLGALFGQEAEDALLMMQKARRQVEVSAQMLYRDPKPQVMTEDNKRTWERFRTDVWDHYGDAMGIKDTVAEKLDECTTRVEKICRPTVDRHFGKKKRTGLGCVLSWLGI